MDDWRLEPSGLQFLKGLQQCRPPQLQFARLLYFFNKTGCPGVWCTTLKSAVLRSFSVIDLGSCAYQLLLEFS